MKTCSPCKATKSLTDFYPGKLRADGTRGVRSQCKECLITYSVARNKEKRTPETNRGYSKEFRISNPGYNAAQAAKFRKENPTKINAWNAESKAAKIQAAPSWLTGDQRAEMLRIYENRPEGCHVDHIVPLRGKDVCGLHVPWNLAYLTAEDNIKKGNRLVT